MSRSAPKIKDFPTRQEIVTQAMSAKIKDKNENWYLLSTKWLGELERKQRLGVFPIVHPIDNSDLLDTKIVTSAMSNGTSKPELHGISAKASEPAPLQHESSAEKTFYTPSVEWLKTCKQSLRNGIQETLDFWFVPEQLWQHYVSQFGIEEPRDLHEIQRKSVASNEPKTFLIEVSPLKVKLEPLNPAAHSQSAYFVASKFTLVSDFKKVVEQNFGFPIISLLLSDKRTPLKSEKCLFDYGLSTNDLIYYGESIDIAESSSATCEYINDSDSQGNQPLEIEFDSDENKPDRFLDMNQSDNEFASPMEDHQFKHEVGKQPDRRFNGYNDMKDSTEDQSDDFETTEILPPIANFCQSSDDNVSLFRANDGRLLASKNAGLRGLYNLGNTCFMNSAIQSLSHCVDLTEYFLSRKFHGELNTTNPLGMKGQLAQAYARVLFQLWNGEKSAVSPHELKYIMSKFNGMFYGYQQHDSQEFLGFLLDGLHEDLNRIIDKPFVENKEYSGKDEKKFAEESWNAYRRRNDSVIVDKFHGQCKSTLVCPECQHVSVTFDPMAYLALPIPLSQSRRLEIVFVPKGSIQPQHFYASFSKTASIEDVKAYLYENHPLFAEAGRQFSVFEISPTDLMPLKELHDYQSVEYFKPASMMGIYEMDDDKCDSIFVYLVQQRRILSYPIALPIEKYQAMSKSQLLDKIAARFGLDFRDQIDKIYTQKWKLSFYQTAEYREMSEDCDVESGLCVFVSLVGEPPSQLRGVLVSNLPFISKGDDEKSEERTQISLYDCLNLFVSPERLGQNDPWYCPKCKTHRQATKKFDIWKCADYLVIFLKRFSSSSRWGSKINCAVGFPITNFDLSGYLPEHNASTSKYNLVAIINHMGSISGGHYTAYALNEADSHWYSFNDSHVRRIDNERELVSANAYVLFYKRIKN